MIIQNNGCVVSNYARHTNKLSKANSLAIQHLLLCPPFLFETLLLGVHYKPPTKTC